MIPSIGSTSRAHYDPTPPPPPTGYEPPGDARDGGWLGQVPPPSAPAPDCGCTKPSDPPYANPGLAPDPWHTTPPLFPHDPTLFG